MSDNPTGAPQIQPGGILVGAAEAMENVAQNWEPVNESGEVAAGAVRQLLAEWPGFLQTIAAAAQMMADKINDQVWQEAGGYEVLAEVSQAIGGVADPLATHATNWDAAHRHLVDGITAEDERVKAWDWAPHHR